MAEWVETFKGSILASEYDAEAYMNSHIYVSRFDQATWFLLHAIGLTPAQVKAHGHRVAIVRQNYQYLRELRGGELVTVRSGYVAVGAKRLRFVHQMRDYETGDMVASSDCTAVLASLETNKTVPLPETLAEAAKARLLVANPPDAAPLGEGG
jgi:acyl-CoA thioesterase FadM